MKWLAIYAATSATIALAWCARVAFFEWLGRRALKRGFEARKEAEASQRRIRLVADSLQGEIDANGGVRR